MLWSAKCVWKFQNNALCDNHKHVLLETPVAVFVEWLLNLMSCNRLIYSLANDTPRTNGFLIKILGMLTWLKPSPPSVFIQLCSPKKFLWLKYEVSIRCGYGKHCEQEWMGYFRDSFVTSDTSGMILKTKRNMHASITQLHVQRQNRDNGT